MMMMMMMMMMIRDAIKKLLVVVVRRPLSSSSASSRPRKTCFFFWACRDSSSCRLYAARDKRNATRFLFPITSDLQKVDSGRDGALERRRRRRRPIDTKPRHRALLPLVSKPHERRDVFFREEEEEERKGCDERMRRRRVLTDDRNNRARRRFDGIWDPKKIEMGCPKERRKAFRNNAFWMWSPLFFFDNLSSAFGRRL